MVGRDSGIFFNPNRGVREMVVYSAFIQCRLRDKACDYPRFLDLTDVTCGHVQRSHHSVPSTELVPNFHPRLALSTSFHRNVLFSIDIEQLNDSARGLCAIHRQVCKSPYHIPYLDRSFLGRFKRVGE